MKNLNVSTLLGWLAAGAVLSVSAPAHAYTLIYQASNGMTTNGWGDSTVTFDVDQSCDAFLPKVQEAIEPAISLWNGVPSSRLKVVLGGRAALAGAITTYVGASASAYAPAGKPLIYCDTAFATNSGANADAIPGFATSPNMTPSGQIQGGLLVLNVQTGAKANVTSMDVTAASIILAHEIGHVLGLGHSSDDNALMYFSTNPDRELVLAQDDLDGISYLYSREELGKNALLGCGSLAVLKGGSGQWMRPGRGGPSGGHDGGGAKRIPAGAAEFSLLIAICGMAVLLAKSRFSNC